MVEFVWYSIFIESILGIFIANESEVNPFFALIFIATKSGIWVSFLLNLIFPLLKIQL